MTNEQFDDLCNRAYWKQGNPPDWYMTQNLCDKVNELKVLINDVHKLAEKALEDDHSASRLGAMLGRIYEMTKQEDNQ